MKILLTGAAGFIGCHVLALLKEHGHQVDGVDCFVSQVHGNCRKVPDGIWRTTVGNAAVQWAKDPNVVYDAVIHLAAEVGVAQSQYEPSRYIDQNVGETGRLWEAILARRDQVKRVVVASSMSLYGEGSYTDDEVCNVYDGGLSRDVARGWDAFDIAEWKFGTAMKISGLTPRATDELKTPEPASVYAQTKYDTERYSLLLGQAYNIPTVALRFFGTYGEGQALGNPYTGVVAIFATRVLNGQPPLVYEDGKQLRDFIHVSDVARAVVAAVESTDPACVGAYNVCTGRPTTVLDLAKRWCAIATERGFPSVEPRVLHTARSGDIRHCFGDASRMRHAFKWRPRLTLREGLNRLADWIIVTDQHRSVPADRSDRAREELRAHGLEVVANRSVRVDS